MAKMLLTEISVRALKGSDKNPKFFDTKTPGFGIRCGLTRKTWVVMRGKNRELVTIGHYPDVSLSDARKEAKRLLSTAPEPRDPEITFKAARETYIAENFKESRSRWPTQVKLHLEKYFKAIEAKRLGDITDDDIKKALDKLANRAGQQLHAFRIVRAFLKWTTRPPRKWIKISPMEGYEAPTKARKGTRILTDDELKAVWNAAGDGSRAVFRLLILWGTRNAETTGIKREWLKDDVLTIPGNSTKNGRDHGIPILPLAKQILEARPEAGPYFFQGRHGDDDSLTGGSLSKMKNEIQEETGTDGWQIRDIRRTFRSNMARLKVPRDVCEVLINHAPPVLDEIYDRYDRLEEKREALAKYEDFMVRLLA